MDIGWRDDTCLGFWQERPDGILVGHAHADRLQPIATYITYVKDFFRSRGYTFGDLWLPHDAKAKSLQTGKAIIDHFRDEETFPTPKLVPRLDLIDGIAALRATFPIIFFNEKETVDLVLAAKSYHYKYDEEKKIYTNEPEHDWSSHYMDMMRYLATVSKKAASKIKMAQEVLVKPVARPLHYGFSLDDIWDLGPKPRSVRI